MMKQESYACAEIISVGTELLLGDILNTDTAFLARGLAELGIPCYYQSVVGDNPARLRAVLETALSRSALILLTGGLGPTCDDLTKETAAALMGKRLVLHEPSYARIQKVLASRGLPETDNQKKQAMLPPDAVVFENNYGTAPGFAMEDEERGITMILMPGPPRELEPLFSEKVRPYLAQKSNQVFYSLNVGLHGIGEAAVEACLRSRMEEGVNPTLAPYCDEGEVRVRITARGKTEEECRTVCEQTAEELRGVSCAPYRPGILDDYIYGIGCDTLQEAVVALLRKQHQTVSAAESCTGGYFAKRLTDIPGASDILEGSFVTYSEGTKQKFTGVSAKTLEECSVYSKEVAEEMARGAMQAAGSDFGIGITGVAGPGDAERICHGTAEVLPAGAVYIACADRTHCVSERFDFAPGRRSPVEAREFVRRRASSRALFFLLSMAKGKL